MQRKWVKLWRKLEDSCLLADPNALQLFIYCLIKATRKEDRISTLFEKQIYYLKPGELIFGRHAVAERLKQSPSTIRNSLERLKKYGILDSKQDNTKSIISICNWAKYQPGEDRFEDNERTTRGQREDTRQEGKERKKVKNTYTSELQELFDYYCSSLNKTLTLTRTRKEIILARLSEGYSVEDIKRALDNFVADPWPDRLEKFWELHYCLGQKTKPETLEKWIHAKPTGGSKWNTL